jgi:membrane protein
MIARVVKDFRDHELLLFASAISFQVLTAVVPLALLGFGLLGFFSFHEVWSKDLAPDLEKQVSRPVFELLDQTVRDVLSDKQTLWVTFGAVLAIWQLSGATRASMGALDRIYRARRRRTIRETLTRSIWLAAAGMLCVFAATAIIVGTPLLVGDLGTLASIGLFLARWLVGGVLLLLAVGLLVHFGPAKPQDVGWTSVGSLLVVIAWAITSIGFGIYLQLIAGNSLFGHLVTVVVGMGYIYGASIAFLIGVQVDAVLRDRVDEEPMRPRLGSSMKSRRSSRPVART